MPESKPCENAKGGMRHDPHQWVEWVPAILRGPGDPEKVQVRWACAGLPVSAVAEPESVPQPTHEPKPEVNKNLLARDLEDWWLEQAGLEAEGVIPKAIEYGSNSLAEQGHLIARLQGREVTEEEALELGAFIYAFGKMQRWCDAVLRQERPSDDTINDIAVYTKMTQRIRYTGSWPGTKENR
jgi:hypothetical protein